MQKLSQALTVATGLNKYKPTATVTTVEVEQLLIETSDLISPTFKSWYCKRYYKLGADKVNKYAAQARSDGRNPARLFSFLIKG